MAPPRRLGRVASAVVSLVVVAGAFAAGRLAVKSFSGAGADSPQEASVASGAGAGSHGLRFDRGLSRGRRRAQSVADELAPGPRTVEEADRDAVARPKPSVGKDAAADSTNGLVTGLASDPWPEPKATPLSTTPDADPASGEAASVDPGRPAEIALTAFVAQGAAAVHRVAELVGERKPELDEGVPVSLTGRVVDADGATPIAGARVIVSSTFYVRRYFYDSHLREVANVETDADGAYRIERLNVDPANFGKGGRLYVTVTADGHAPAPAIPLADVSPGVANRLPDVALQRATQTLRGRVIDMWQGLPVVGARVYATGAIDPLPYPKDERPALFVGAPVATTDADGRFAIDGLGAGVQTITAYGGDDCIGESVVSLPHGGEITMSARQIRGRIEGTTLDERGEPVSLVTIEGGENSTHSFVDGHFVLENFRGDVVTIAFTHPDYAPAVVAGVQNGAAGLVVHMERPRPTIVLDVRDPDTSAPIPHVQLELTFADERDRPAATSPERLSADGRYAVRVPKGATAVAVSAGGRTTEQVSLAHRADGETVRVLLAAASGN